MGKVNRNSELLYLRIGDIVAYKGELVKVTSDILNLGVDLSNGDDDVPIYDLDLVLITEEILIKLGFEYNDILDCYYLWMSGGSIKYIVSTQKLIINNNGIGLVYPNCAYLHDFCRCINLIDDQDLLMDFSKINTL